MAGPYADQFAPLTSPVQTAGAVAPARREDDDAELKAISNIADAANGSVPLLGIGKQLARYIATKTAAKSTLNSKTPVDLAHKLDEVTHKEWRDWLPETLRDYCGLTDADKDVRALDILMALQVAVTNVDVFSEWQLFYAVCAPFNDRRANFEWLDKPSYLECALTCHWLRALRPNTDFGPGVIRFLLAVMLEDGLVFFPWTGGDGIALDDGENGKYVRGLTDCQELAKDMRKVWEAGVVKGADPAELPDVDERDPHHVQLAKLMNGAAYIRANEGTT
jgi:hypothetical protein